MSCGRFLGVLSEGCVCVWVTESEWLSCILRSYTCTALFWVCVPISLHCSISVQYNAHKCTRLHTHCPIKTLIIWWLSQENSGIFAQRWTSAHSDRITTAGSYRLEKTQRIGQTQWWMWFEWHMRDSSDDSGWTGLTWRPQHFCFPHFWCSAYVSVLKDGRSKGDAKMSVILPSLT